MKKRLSIIISIFITLFAMRANIYSDELYTNCDDLKNTTENINDPLYGKHENNLGLNSPTNDDYIVESISILPMSLERPDIGTGSGYPSGQYNWVYSYPSNSSNYNCYSFILGKTNSFYAPGDFSGQIDYANCNISTLNNAVINDLKAIGKKNVKLVNSSYQQSSGETVIAFRRSYNSNGSFRDFHFMKKNTTSEQFWLHKPGATAILIYKNKASSGIWPGEYYNGSWHIGSSYEGSISYVAFK